LSYYWQIVAESYWTGDDPEGFMLLILLDFKKHDADVAFGERGDTAEGFATPRQMFNCSRSQIYDWNVVTI
jgi:hypothetical protein